ncbi:MAG: hypothetical protein WBE91_04740 [Steroidobacteraceae bacterium]
MRRLHLILSAVLLALPLAAGAQSNRVVTVIDNPGGGTIAYAQMPHQHTLRGAMGKVLLYVHSRFGARPQIAKVMRGSDGNSLAVTFTVKSGNQEIAGLALVAVSPSGPGKGAVLSDQADRFRSTVGPMLRRLQSGAGLSGKGSSPTAVAANAPASAQGSGAAAATSSAPSSAGPSAAVSSPTSDTVAAAGTPAAALHQTPFPDGSGSIGLPDGWTITGAHAGQVIAKGPAAAGLHFDWPIPVVDPRSQGSRRGGAAGPVAIPYGTDGADTVKSAITQLYQKQGKAPPTIDIVGSKSVGPQESVVVANIGSIDGQSPARSLVDIGIGPLDSLGGYTITLYTISFPQQIAAQSQATVTAIFHSYKVNQDVALSQIHADTQNVQQITETTVSTMQRNQDVQDRQFQAFDNNLLDRTVIRDTDLNGDGTVSNDLAQALIQSNPDRFQEVSPSDYVQGIDY